MISMNNLRFFQYAIGALIIFNLGLIVYIFSDRKGHERGEHRNRDLIIERLHLDAAQVRKYDESIAIHQSEMHEVKSQMNNLRRRLYHQIGNEDSAIISSSIDSIAVIQSRFEMIHYRHFRAIRNLCHEDQLDEFQQLVEDLPHMFNPPRPPRH